MSNELDNQISESVFNDKILNFYHKRKYYIIFFVIIIIATPILYQAKVAFEKHKSASELESYSVVVNELIKSNPKEAVIQLQKLTTSNNDTIVLLALNQLLEINKSSKQELVKTLDTLIDKKKLSKRNDELLKIKKSLLIFDAATENQMLDLLDTSNKDSSFRKTSLQILYDFHLSKNQKIKAEEVKRLINEN
jgi:predicted negative regulator of RcsB-dependent stress response